MGEFEVTGPDRNAFVQRVTCNDVGALKPGQAQYSAILTDQGTFVDDCLVYRFADRLMLVVNAANIAADWAHVVAQDRKSTRLNSSHSQISYAVFCLKKKNKKSAMPLAAKGVGAKEWNNSLKTKLSLLPKKLFRIRMSRNIGMKMLTMPNLSTECVIQLTKLGYDATPFNQIFNQNAKRHMRFTL